MLNFNRSYEQEWLRKMRSPMAFAPIGTTEEQKKRGIPQARTLSEAIMSFVNDLGGDRTKGVEADANFVSIENASSSLKLKPFLEEAVADRNKDTFVEDYKRLRKIDPKTGLYLETGEKAY
jgi:hypothetical protein